MVSPLLSVTPVAAPPSTLDARDLDPEADPSALRSDQPHQPVTSWPVPPMAKWTPQRRSRSAIRQ